MTDEVVRLPVIWQLLRKRWRLLIAVTAAGTLAGAAASYALSPGYESTSQVLFRSDLEESAIDVQAQLVTSSTVLDRVAVTLGWDATGADLRDDIAADGKDGGLIEITGAAATPQLAQELANQVATEYVDFTTSLIATTDGASAQLRAEQIEALRRQVEAANDRIDRLHGIAERDDQTLGTVRVRTQLESLRKDLSEAMSDLTEATAATGSEKPLILGPASLPTTKAAPTLAHLAVGGGGVGFLLGGFGLLLAARSDTRLRDTGEIGAALGVPVTGTVAVTNTLTRQPRWSRSQRSEPPLSLEMERRYLDVLNSLTTDDEARKLLLVAATDDPVARRAVARLAMAAGKDESRCTVRRVAHINPAEPNLEADDDSSAALLVLSAGSRTGWELLDIAMACVVAGHPLAGAVVARPTRRAPKSSEPGTAGPATTDDALAVSS